MQTLSIKAEKFANLTLLAMTAEMWSKIHKAKEKPYETAATNALNPNDEATYPVNDWTAFVQFALTKNVTEEDKQKKFFAMYGASLDAFLARPDVQDYYSTLDELHASSEMGDDMDDMEEMSSEPVTQTAPEVTKENTTVATTAATTEASVAAPIAADPKISNAPVSTASAPVAAPAPATTQQAQTLAKVDEIATKVAAAPAPTGLTKKQQRTIDKANALQAAAAAAAANPVAADTKIEVGTKAPEKKPAKLQSNTGAFDPIKAQTRINKAAKKQAATALSKVTGKGGNTAMFFQPVPGTIMAFPVAPFGWGSVGFKAGEDGTVFLTPLNADRNTSPNYFQVGDKVVGFKDFVPEGTQFRYPYCRIVVGTIEKWFPCVIETAVKEAHLKGVSAAQLTYSPNLTKFYVPTVVPVMTYTNWTDAEKALYNVVAFAQGSSSFILVKKDQEPIKFTGIVPK